MMMEGAGGGVHLLFIGKLFWMTIKYVKYRVGEIYNK